MIYGQPMLAVVHHTDPLAIVPDPLSPSLVLPPARVTNEEEALVYDYQEPRPDRLQKEGPGVKSLPGTTISQDLVECIGCRKLRLLGS